MSSAAQPIGRLWRSAVVWQWGFHALRMGSNILLLPLLLRLSDADFGFYYVLLSLGTLGPVLDMGLIDAITRSIGYAMGGAKELKAQGLVAIHEKDSGPNYNLLWQLLQTTQAIYRGLSLIVFVGLGAWGTYQVSLRVEETSSPSLTWFAWGLTLASAVFEMYAGWWNNYLKGLNEVLLSTRIAAMGFLVKFLVSCALLVAGLGLLSVPVATFVSTMLQRMLSRHYVLRRLDSHPRPPRDQAQFRQLLAVLWPNSWRLGLHLFGTLMVGNAMTFLCVKHLGLAVNGQYGLSLQIASICQNMAFTWMSVKLPLIFQMRAKADLPGLRALMRQRTWLCIVTYLVLAVGAAGLGDIVVHWLDPRKALLPPVWFAVLLGSSFFALLYNQWGTFILAENRVPYLWPTLATNAGSVALCAILLQTTSTGAGALVLAPFIVWSSFNYWYWPAYAARTLETTLLRLLFGRAEKEGGKR